MIGIDSAVGRSADSNYFFQRSVPGVPLRFTPAFMLAAASRAGKVMQ